MTGNQNIGKGFHKMTITDVLEENCRKFGDDICLVEINPAQKETRRVTWREYELMEPNPSEYYRREISWNVFNEKANRFANLLLSRGIKKGDKVAILLMNGLEWLPIYFGILKTGALAAYTSRRLMRRPTYYSDIEEIIGNNKGHLIASSACLGSYLDKLILQWKKPEPGYKEVQKSIGVLKRISDFLSWCNKVFGSNNFYLEIQPCKEDNVDQLMVVCGSVV